MYKGLVILGQVYPLVLISSRERLIFYSNAEKPSCRCGEGDKELLHQECIITPREGYRTFQMLSRDWTLLVGGQDAS